LPQLGSILQPEIKDGDYVDIDVWNEEIETEQNRLQQQLYDLQIQLDSFKKKIENGEYVEKEYSNYSNDSSYINQPTRPLDFSKLSIKDWFGYNLFKRHMKTR
jgi:hypothetical protein